MYANEMQETKLRQAELIREARNYRLIKSLRKSQTRGKYNRILRSLASALTLS